MTGKKGFTLVELLAAMTISLLAVMALAALLMGAGRVIHTLDSRSERAVIDAQVTLEHMKKELQESPVVASVAFKGQSDQVSFPGLIPVTAGKALSQEFVLGQMQNALLGVGGAFKYATIRYRFDRSRGLLLRSEENGEEKTVLSDVAGCEFFYALGPLDNSKKNWSPETPPSGSAARMYGMEVQLKLNQTPGYPPALVRRTFILYRQHPLNAMTLTETSGVSS